MYVPWLYTRNFIIYSSSFEYVFQPSACIRVGAKTSHGKTWSNNASRDSTLKPYGLREVVELQDRGGMQPRWGSGGSFKIRSTSGISREGSQIVTCTRNVMGRAEIPQDTQKRKSH